MSAARGAADTGDGRGNPYCRRTAPQARGTVERAGAARHWGVRLPVAEIGSATHEQSSNRGGTRRADHTRGEAEPRESKPGGQGAKRSDFPPSLLAAEHLPRPGG